MTNVCYEAGLVVTATLLVVIALGILLIMLRLSRQYTYDGSSSPGIHHSRLTAPDDEDDGVNGTRQHTRTYNAVNLTVNPVDMLLQHQVGLINIL